MVRLAEFDLVYALADLASDEERTFSSDVVAMGPEALVALVLALVRVD